MAVMAGASMMEMLMGGLAGAGMAKMMGGQSQPALTPPPQPSQAPSTQNVAAGQAGTGQAGGAAGIAQTFLSGTGGIDPSLLKLGKTSLLGGG